jgi:DNA-binding winged helix-turn-helix (wHTH) protein
VGVNYRFGVFEFESGSGELRKSGRPVALEPQPSRALARLLARADQLVTRDELKDAVWGKDTHVERFRKRVIDSSRLFMRRLP